MKCLGQKIQMFRLFLSMAMATCGFVRTWAQHDPGEPVLKQPDLNGDGHVDVLDLVGLLNLFERTDLDRDGIWDHEDECVGWYDACGVCNGPGPLQFEIAAIVPRKDSMRIELTGEWFVFEAGSDTLFRPVCENRGCTDPLALNFDPLANVSDPKECAYPGGDDACGGKTAIIYNDHLYPVVALGEQCWFAENLNVTHFRDGSPIPTGKSANLWSEMGTNGLAAVGSLRLGGKFQVAIAHHYYNFHAVVDSRGLCPAGWRIPTDEDWQDLFTTMTADKKGAEPKGRFSIGKEVKAGPLAGVADLHPARLQGHSSAMPKVRDAEEVRDWVPHWDGTDVFGFHVLPVGLRDRFGFYDYVSHASAFWSSTAAGRSFSWAYFLGEGNDEVARMNLMMSYGLAVRCVH